MKEYNLNNKGIKDLSIVPSEGYLEVEKLDLSENPIETGIVEFIKRFHCLRVLNLSDSGLLPNQLTGLAALEVVSSNLSVLSIKYNELPSIFFARSLNALEVLEIAGNPVRDLDFLSQTPNLETLYCSCTEISNLEPIRGLSKLKHLYISGTKINSSAIQALIELKTLESIYMQDVDIAPQHLTRLDELDHLTVLVVDYEPGMQHAKESILSRIKQRSLQKRAASSEVAATNMEESMPPYRHDIDLFVQHADQIARILESCKITEYSIRFDDRPDLLIMSAADIVQIINAEFERHIGQAARSIRISSYSQTKAKEIVETSSSLTQTDKTTFDKAMMKAVAQDGNIPSLRQYIEAGKPFDDFIDEWGTVLHYAAANGQFDCLQLILQTYANQCLEKYRLKDGMAKLVKFVNLQDGNWGNSALHLAARQVGLLQANFGQDAPKSELEKKLAALERASRSVELLLRYRADPLLKNRDGKTPAQFCITNLPKFDSVQEKTPHAHLAERFLSNALSALLLEEVLEERHVVQELSERGYEKCASALKESIYHEVLSADVEVDEKFGAAAPDEKSYELKIGSAIKDQQPEKGFSKAILQGRITTPVSSKLTPEIQDALLKSIAQIIGVKEDDIPPAITNAVRGLESVARRR